MRLLSIGSTNTKLSKGGGLNARYLNFILHLAPSTLSGYNTCPKASTGCAAACLNTAGRGVFSNVQEARIRKTKQLFQDRQPFILDIISDLNKALRKAQRESKQCVVRLNGTSDIAWEKIKVQDGLTLFDLFPEIIFYDYTKIITRAIASVQSETWPKNYTLTFSAIESNQEDTWRAIDAGVNVAIVFDRLPSMFGTVPVINGDDHDYRFLDERGVIVGLTAKGKAKKDQSGFVLRVPTSELASASRIDKLATRFAHDELASASRNKSIASRSAHQSPRAILMSKVRKINQQLNTPIAARK